MCWRRRRPQQRVSIMAAKQNNSGNNRIRLNKQKDGLPKFMNEKLCGVMHADECVNGGANVAHATGLLH